MKAALPWVVLALAVWAAGLVRAKVTAQRDVVRPEWQHSFLELEAEGQRSYRLIREGLLELERLRVDTGRWPSVDQLVSEGIEPFTDTWVLRQHGTTINYIGTQAGVRWLVVILEPERASAQESSVPFIDEEHHVLRDGTLLHVTVWSQSPSEPLSTGVLPFPLAEGWVQRVGQ